MSLYCFIGGDFSNIICNSERIKHLYQSSALYELLLIDVYFSRTIKLHEKPFKKIKNTKEN